MEVMVIYVWHCMVVLLYDCKVIYMEPQGKEDQRPRSNSEPTLYRGVSATRATETGRDPPPPSL